MSVPTNAGTGFTRRIDPIEWWFLGFPRRVSAALNLCVEGAGHIDPAELRRAVAIASRACPGARLVRRGRTWVDSGVTPAVTVAPGVPAEAPELRTPLPGRAGRTCEVVLFPGPQPTVVFRAGHAVMDARGLLWWARDVFRVLRGEEPVGATSAATFEDLDDPLHRRAGESESESGSGSGSGSESGSRVPALLGVPPGADLRRQLWRRRTIEGTVPALEARLAAALVELSGHAVAPVGFVVDVRPGHPGIRSTGNLSLAVSLDLRAGDAWPDVDRQLAAALADRTCRVDAPGAEVLKAPLPLLRHIVRRVDRGARRDDRHSLLAEVYHLGPVRPGWFHTDDFTAAAGYALCPMEPGAALSVVATEGDGRTDLTLSWWDGPGMAERADALLDRLGAALVPQETG